MVSLAIDRIDNLVDHSLSLGAIQVRAELLELASVIADLKPVNVMEIGSEAGGTFYLWCRLASGIKISVDLPTGASGSGRYAKVDALAERKQLMESWAKDVIVITGDSGSLPVFSKVKKALNGQLLDFLFIDGDHSYQGAKTDYVIYSQYVRSGGLIAFHDIKDTEYHSVRGCEVAKFWRELRGEKREILGDETWGGIGLLRKV